jgi:Flp pilus assembly CpaF family ATPase
VENKKNHPRDATMLEDKCRSRVNNTVANLSLRRGATLMLWKKSKTKRTAPDFIRTNLRNFDAQITLIKEINDLQIWSELP